MDQTEGFRREEGGRGRLGEHRGRHLHLTGGLREGGLRVAPGGCLHRTSAPSLTPFTEGSVYINGRTQIPRYVDGKPFDHALTLRMERARGTLEKLLPRPTEAVFNKYVERL